MVPINPFTLRVRLSAIEDELQNPELNTVGICELVNEREDLIREIELLENPKKEDNG